MNKIQSVYDLLGKNLQKTSNYFSTKNIICLFLFIQKILQRMKPRETLYIVCTLYRHSLFNCIIIICTFIIGMLWISVEVFSEMYHIYYNYFQFRIFLWQFKSYTPCYHFLRETIYFRFLFPLRYVSSCFSVRFVTTAMVRIFKYK